MLGKLLKHDLKWVYKIIVVFYVLSFIFSILGRLLSQIENSLIFDVVSKIVIGIAISLAVSALINCMMRLWARFILNVYKDESYLTHTLPIKKSTIFNSKVLACIITIFTTMIVAIVCLFICYYSKENMQVLKQLLEIAASTYDTTVLRFLAVVLFVIFLEAVYIILTGYVGIIFGHKSNQKKMLKSIIIAFVIYMAMQTLTLAGIGIYGLFNQEVMNIINTTNIVNMDAIKSVMYLGIVIYCAYIVVLYAIGKKQLQKGVNVE